MLHKIKQFNPEYSHSLKNVFGVYLTHSIPMTSRDVSRSRSTQVRRRPETFFLVTRDKGVNQD